MSIVAKYTGDGSEFLNGVPATDLGEDDFAALTDEQRVAVRDAKASNGKPLYSLRGDAPKDADRAEKRAEKATKADGEA